MSGKRHIQRALLTALLATSAALALAAPASAAGPLSWSASHIRGGGQMLAVSCPSRVLCVAFNAAGRVFVSTRPAAGGSSFHKVRGLAIPTNLGFSSSLQLFDVACPSNHLCLTATQGTLVYTTNPTGGASAWHRATLDPAVDDHIDSIACRTAHFCVALSNNTGGGAVGASAMTFTSTNPAGGAAAWSAGPTLQNVNSAGLACPNMSFCVAGTDSGVEWISHITDPAATWQFMMGGTTGSIDSVACPSLHLCLAVPTITAMGNNDIVSTNPTAGSWRQTPVGTGYLTCAARTLCVGTAGPGLAVWASTNPAGGRSSWHLTHIARGPNFLREVSCPSTRFCVAVGDGGSVAVGHH
jgi:hypothetical protein